MQQQERLALAMMDSALRESLAARRVETARRGEP